MITLKIVASETQWLAGVWRVVEVGHFDISPDESDDTFLKRSDRAFAAAEKAGLYAPSKHANINTVEFGDAVTGVVIDVYYAEDERVECWIVPARSCFLMGENGQTIDRI